MNMETRELIFVSIVGLLLSTFIGLMNNDGFGLKGSLLLFTAVLVGFVIYSYKKDESTAVYDFLWFLVPALAALLVIPLIQGRLIVGIFLTQAFLFAIMLSVPPLLLRVRKQLFTIK